MANDDSIDFEAEIVMKKFPIVCVGGSAGGLDAYIRLLQNLPCDMGVAIVIVNHITIMPTQLHEVLPRFTTMPVDLITESLLVGRAGPCLHYSGQSGFARRWRGVSP